VRLVHEWISVDHARFLAAEFSARAIGGLQKQANKYIRHNQKILGSRGFALTVLLHA